MKRKHKVNPITFLKIGIKNMLNYVKVVENRDNR